MRGSRNNMTKTSFNNELTQYDYLPVPQTSHGFRSRDLYGIRNTSPLNHTTGMSTDVRQSQDLNSLMMRQILGPQIAMP